MTAPQLTQYVQGQGSVSADGLNTFIQSTNLISDLRDFIGVTGIQVYARGQLSVNDGNGGFYYWIANGIGPDDGFSIIVPFGAATGVWGRIAPPSSGGGLPTSSNANKIINGDFRINQRYGQNVPVVLPTAIFVPDRWVGFASAPGKISLASLPGPSSVVGSIPGSYFSAMVSQGAYAPAAGEAFGLVQGIEGFNCQDLHFGQPFAQPISVSFWARTNVPGQYGGSIRNGATTRSFTFSFVMQSVNVWQKVTITIPGDTIGAWTIDNTAGLYLFLCVAAGAGFQTVPGVWTAGNFFTVPGQTNLVSANGNEMLITGVKLETGSDATPFVPDDYEVSFGKCRRYFQRPSWSAGEIVCQLNATGVSSAGGKIIEITPMRATPTVVLNGQLAGFTQTLAGNSNLVGINIAANASGQVYCVNVTVAPAIWTLGGVATIGAGIGGAALEITAEL